LNQEHTGTDLGRAVRLVKSDSCASFGPGALPNGEAREFREGGSSILGSDRRSPRLQNNDSSPGRDARSRRPRAPNDVEGASDRRGSAEDSSFGPRVYVASPCEKTFSRNGATCSSLGLPPMPTFRGRICFPRRPPWERPTADAPKRAATPHGKRLDESRRDGRSPPSGADLTSYRRRLSAMERRVNVSDWGSVAEPHEAISYRRRSTGPPTRAVLTPWEVPGPRKRAGTCGDSGGTSLDASRVRYRRRHVDSE